MTIKYILEITRGQQENMCVAIQVYDKLNARVHLQACSDKDSTVCMCRANIHTYACMYVGLAVHMDYIHTYARMYVRRTHGRATLCKIKRGHLH